MKRYNTDILELPGCEIPVWINGRTYTLLAVPELTETLSKLANEAARLSSLTADGGRSGVAAGFLARAIDTLLGEGTVDEVFGGREPDLFGLCEIITYIAARFGNYREMRRRRLAEEGGLGA